MNNHGWYYDVLVGQSCIVCTKWFNIFMLVRIQFLQIHPYLLEARQSQESGTLRTHGFDLCKAITWAAGS